MVNHARTFRTRREAKAHIATMRGWDAKAVKIDMSGEHPDANGTGDWHRAGPDGRYQRSCHCLAAGAYVKGPWIIMTSLQACCLRDDGYVR